MNIKKPYFWDLPKPNLISYLLIPFSIPIIIRNFFFKIVKKRKITKIKTICVGNIYIGGTGKTPLTVKIFEILRKLEKNIATVKKDYSDQKDEQILLRKKTTLILSKSRTEAIKQGIDKRYNILIFDDGLQETKIDYDLKFVCFKSKYWIGNGQYIPAGPLREKISSLKRFDAVFLNGNSNNFERIQNQILTINSNIKIFKTFYKISNLKEFDLNLKYLIFSGIGNPSDFKDILLDNNFDIAQEMVFPDHYEYSEKNFKNIIDIARKKNFKIITTEKDFMKVSDKFKAEIKYLAIDLIVQNENKLENMLKEL